MANGRINDMFKQLEEVMNKCDSLSQEIKNERIAHKKEIKKIKDEFKIERNQLKSEISSLKQTIKEKDKKIEKLTNEVDRLKKIVNNNSDNSSNPPSTDIKPNKKDVSNNREKSGKKVGGQKGHKGASLSKQYVKEKIENKEFKHEVIEVGTKTDKYVSKFVLDIEVNVVAKEYRFYRDENGKYNIPKEFQTDVQYGSEIKTLCAILNTQGVVAINRLTDFVSSISHGKLNVSNGSIVNFTNELKEKCLPIINSIQEKILNSKLMYTDATSARCNNKNVAVRNYSTKTYTLLKATNTKSMKDINKTGILSQYEGNLMHDHETAIYNYGNKHAECNVHIGRYLKGNFENTKNNWSKDMRHFLNSLNEYRKRLINNGINCMPKEKLKKYSLIYDKILNKGYEQNKKTKSQYYKKEEKKLLNRMKKYKENHLLFLYDFSMPFDNNLSEREIRHVKMKQKISGHFKSINGLQGYLDIKSIIITCNKLGKDFYEYIKSIFQNIPVTI